MRPQKISCGVSSVPTCASQNLQKKTLLTEGFKNGEGIHGVQCTNMM